MKNLPTLSRFNPLGSGDCNRAELNQRHRWLIGLTVFSLIVAVGIASRIWLVEMPNFKPVAALVLFGGFFFRRAWPAIAALVLIMVVSDLQLGVYSWKLALSVYGSLGLACWLGVWVKRSLKADGPSQLGFQKLGLKQWQRFGLASLAMSTVFYLLTNGAVWSLGSWYPRDAAGLIQCYAAGLPFYRATLMGDLFFTGALVSGYCAVEFVIARAGFATAGSARQRPAVVAGDI